MSDGAQSVTFCSITSLQNQPHTLTVTMGSNGVDNVLIDNFHIFSDSLHHPSTGTGSTSQKASNSGPMASSPPTPVRNTPQINLSTSHISRGSTPLSSKPSSLLSATTYLWRDPSVHTSLSQPRPPSASPHTAIIGSIVGGVVLLVVVISLLLCKLWKRRIRKGTDRAQSVLYKYLTSLAYFQKPILPRSPIIHSLRLLRSYGVTPHLHHWPNPLLNKETVPPTHTMVPYSLTPNRTSSSMASLALWPPLTDTSYYRSPPGVS